MSTRDFDLNLLKVLIALLQEKNTSRAAEVLDTSQPSVSRALAKLRTQLNDPLFYRDKQGLKLSPRAQSLAESLPASYQSLLDTFEESIFQPENYNGKIKIAMNAYISEIFGSKIYLQLKKTMPKLTIEILSWNERSTQQILEDQVDMAISFLPMNLLKGIYEKHITTLNFGFIVNKRLFGDLSSIDITEAVTHPLCTVLIPEYNTQSLRFENQAKTKLGKLNIILKCHSITPILDLVEKSDALFVAPKKLFKLIDQNLFHYIDIDNLNANVTNANIGLMYHAKKRTSPVFKWFEQEITTSLQEENKE
ncbi:LysR family transcriptional regulator [Thalassotalea psychrophila]|uniref:LysR family transcriptional regulator n=1 Tax=Thalassotalea psychrophila TaxID=3065647 RepID=A0ABY9TY60_9GAMM|nr:LysR family transcriptional regulator [Colwelliaceae bacterium SQ149]